MDNSPKDSSVRLTYHQLRSRGFRLTSGHVDNTPHLVLNLQPSDATALEISGRPDGRWTVWLRGDLAYSRARFCYLRDVDTIEQVDRLIEAVTDRLPKIETFDVATFDEGLEFEKADCQRRYREMCSGERRSYVPGG